MISIAKGAEPNSLVINKANWTTQLLALIAANQPIPDSIYKRYNQADVKASLITECNKKCMYCESKVGHVTVLHIEHIKPKARDKFPQLTYEYDNLGLACPICNNNKSDIYDNMMQFINPYINNPANHFYSIGAFVWAKAGDQRAKLTETQIDLNRPELIEARGERLKTIKALIDEYIIEQNQTIKNSLKAQILKEIDKSKPYVLCTKTFTDALL
jgi:hypothetical protein